jgi:hypothetical protein
VLAFTLLVTLFGYDAAAARPPRNCGRRALRFRCGVAFLHLAQPVVRTRARWKENRLSRRRPPAYARLPGPVQRLARGVLLLPEDRPRAQLAADLVGDLRRAGISIVVPSGWEDHDATMVGSWLVLGELVTTAYPAGCIQIRVRRRVRATRLALGLALTALCAAASPWLAAVCLAALAADAVRGNHRMTARVRLVVEEATR